MAFRRKLKITRLLRAELFRLQLHSDSSYTSRESGDGRWRRKRLWSVEDLVPSGSSMSGGRKERHEARN